MDNTAYRDKKVVSVFIAFFVPLICQIETLMANGIENLHLDLDFLLEILFFSPQEDDCI
jgi:hypothetical protein